MSLFINASKTAISLGLFLAILVFGSFSYAQESTAKRFGIVLHGGAGTILKKNMSEEKEKAYQDKLEEALSVGHAILKDGGSSLDAVEATIKVLEDSPLFNAGKGAVFTNDASHELDASIMDGKTLQAGAVANVRHIKNPIHLARLVMEKSPHVLLISDGAETFAREHDVEWVTQDYFFTERRWQQLMKRKAEEDTTGEKPNLEEGGTNHKENGHGTVGVAALDQAGNLAAGTSTGGMTNKAYGRVGDSPIIGAGTYANNQTCAISATGDGEYFIRLQVAHDIHALMAYHGNSLEEAANLVIKEKLEKLGGEGGIVAIDKNGNIAMVFNSEGMYRGYVREDGKKVIQIYKD